MARFRSVVALAFLAVLAVGGTGAPVVHKVLHAAEAERTEAELAAHTQNGHHHHTVEDDHGREILPPCPAPLDTHLTCVLCAHASVSVALETVALITPEVEAADWRTPSDRTASRASAANGARGPPALV